MRAQRLSLKFRRLQAGFLLLALLTACSRASKPLIVATVDSEPILASELQRALSEQAGDYGPDILGDPEGLAVVKKTLLNALIQEKALLQTAREKGITLSDEEEKALQADLQDGYGKGELERVLKEKKVDIDAWTESRKNKKIIEKLFDLEVYSLLTPTEKEVAEHYKKYRATFRVPDRIRCRHIVTGKRDKAEKIRSLLEKGENFASVAKKYSESPDREAGGDLGFIARGEYPEIFERACFSLVTGQTSDVLASEYGFHIFRVTDKEPAHQRPLSEVAGEISLRLKEEKAEPALRAWLDGVYRNKKITIDDKALKGVSVEMR